MSQELSGVFYEWDAELCDRLGDISRHFHAVRLEELKNTPTEIDATGDWWNRLVLIRRVFKGGDLIDTSWGYVNKNGELPTHTDGGDKIPQKYHKEFAQNIEWASKLGDRIDWEKNLADYIEKEKVQK